jgi:hypothetical protein
MLVEGAKRVVKLALERVEFVAVVETAEKGNDGGA